MLIYVIYVDIYKEVHREYKFTKSLEKVNLFMYMDNRNEKEQKYIVRI